MISIINKFDNYVVNIVKTRQNKYLDVLMPKVTALGNLGLIWIVIAVALMMNKPYRLIGDLVIITLIISTIVGEGIIKHSIRRMRPCVLKDNAMILIAKPITYSFPSGHTLSSFAVAGVLSVYLTQYKLIFIALACLIAFSRLYLQVHYPTDILAGMIAGLLCTKLVLMLVQGNYMQDFIIAINSLF